MRDLVALSTLPAIWNGQNPEGIARSLAEVLFDTLLVDFVYIRLRGLVGEEVIEVVRTRIGSDPDNVEAVKASLKSILSLEGANTPATIPDPFGDGILHLAITRFGIAGDLGVLITGSQNNEYPTERDRLLLGVGANQTTMVVQRLRAEERLREQGERLRELADRLSEADRRKDEFLATLAHELRNPLAPIRTGLEVMKLAKDDPATIEEIRCTMERQTNQLVMLVDDLLDVSRISKGKLELRKCRVKLADVVQSAVEASRPFIVEFNHELTVAIPEQPIFLDADPNRLAQVLSNLLNNSTKYTPEGGRIRLSSEQQGSDVVISVEDNGLGIPSTMLERIFEMFAQIDRPHEKGYTGLGIGLSLVKSLVEMHAGRIEVYSEGTGKGSVFSVRLPILHEPSGEDCAPSHSDGSPQKTTNKRKVLVVDDNKAAATMLSMVVRMLGNDVRKAHDGKEGIEVAEEFMPDVILMDIGMPKMNGYDAARHIRRQPWSNGMMLVALTGWGQEEDKIKTKDAGFDHHLVKPAEPAAIQNLLNNFTKERAR
ncbi:hybrid sensor histidine kinase/response regulator [Novipirellula rosea]